MQAFISASTSRMPEPGLDSVWLGGNRSARGEEVEPDPVNTHSGEARKPLHRMELHDIAVGIPDTQ